MLLWALMGQANQPLQIFMGLDGYRDVKGDILFNGKSISKLSVTERAKKGITLAWQEPARFEGLKKRELPCGE